MNSTLILMDDWCGSNNAATRKELKMRAQKKGAKTQSQLERSLSCQKKDLFCDGEVFFS
jgi:hypothetical protein